MANIHGWNKQLEKAGQTPVRPEKINYEVEYKKTPEGKYRAKKDKYYLKIGGSFFFSGPSEVRFSMVERKKWTFLNYSKFPHRFLNP